MALERFSLVESAAGALLERAGRGLNRETSCGRGAARAGQTEEGAEKKPATREIHNFFLTFCISLLLASCRFPASSQHLG